MSKSIITEHNQGIIKVLKGDVVCDSKDLADYFGKEHKFVLRAIRKAEDSLESNGGDFAPVKNYFKKADYIDSKGESRPKYLLTFKGFNLIGLAFTGEKAFIHRVRFINAFEELLKTVEQNKLLEKVNLNDSVMIQLRAETKEARTKLTDAIQEWLLPQRVAENKETSQFVSRYISSYTKLVYKALNIAMPIGVTNNRDVLGARDLIAVESIELKMAGLIREFARKEIYYKEIYQMVKKEVLNS